MRLHRTFGVLAGAAAIALAVLTVASPASAATLPAGQKITVIDDLDDSGPQEGQFYDVDPADAVGTPVGTGSGVYAYGVDVADDGLGYALVSFGGPELWKVDANTGTASNPVTIHLANIEPYDCEGIDLNQTTGELLVACVWFTNEDGNVAVIGPIDPDTGLLTPDVSISGPESPRFTALALNPVTGVLWAFDYDESYIVDRALHTATPQATLDGPAYAADFDRDGQLFVASWATGENQFQTPSLAITDPAVGTFTFNQAFANGTNGEELEEVESLTVWGKEALPATGPAVILPLGLGTALLLLVGAAFVATNRISRYRGVTQK